MDGWVDERIGWLVGKLTGRQEGRQADKHTDIYEENNIKNRRIH